MPRKVIPPHGRGSLNSYEPGESGNPNGRPRKIALTLQHGGYKKAEIVQTFEVMASLTMDEFEEFAKNKNITVLEKGIVKMIEDFIKKGKNEVLEYIIPKKQFEEIAKTNAAATYENPVDGVMALLDKARERAASKDSKGRGNKRTKAD